MISLRILFIFHDGPFAKRVFFSWQVVILRQHSATTTYFSSHDFWLKSCVLNEKSFLLGYLTHIIQKDLTKNASGQITDHYDLP